MKPKLIFHEDNFVFPLIFNNESDFSSNIPCFLVENNENVLFSLACNYLSLGQFELGRSAVSQLVSMGSDKAHELLISIVINGQPPDWQLSPSIPSSAHLIYACIKELQLLLNCSDYENNKKNELDLLLAHLILESFPTKVNYNWIKEIRQFYNVVLNLISSKNSRESFFISELRFLPKLISIPQYLNRIPSYSIKPNCFFEEYRTEILISELLNYSLSSPRLFVYIYRNLIMNEYTAPDSCNLFVETSGILINSLQTIRLSLQWVIMKSCFSIINSNVEVSISIDLLRDNIYKYSSELIFEFLFVGFNEIDRQKYCISNKEYPIHLYEKPLLFIFSFNSLLNFFSRYDLSEKVLINYLKRNLELLKKYESICFYNSFNSKAFLNFEKIKINNFFKRNDFLFKRIWECIGNVERMPDNSHFDYIGELINSNSSETLLLDMVLDNDVSLIREYFGFNTPLGIISLTKFTKKELDNSFYRLFFNSKLSYFETLENGPIYWCEFLSYLKVMKHRYEETPILFTIKILSKRTFDEYSIDIIEKLNTLFPNFRPLNTFLGLKDDLIYNWKLIKSLWLPFRLGDNKIFFSNENELLVNKLDELSRLLLISISVTKLLGFDYSMNDNLFEERTKIIFGRIKTKRSVIRCFIEDNNNGSECFKWKLVEELISGIISLPITNGIGETILIQECDCIKSYLIFEELLNFLNKSNPATGSRMQSISVDLGRLNSDKFYEELMYSCYCLILVLFEDLTIKISPKDGYSVLDSFSLVFYYLFIWSDRLFFTKKLQMLKIIANIFEKYLFFVEFLLYSTPIKTSVSSNSNNDLYIFTWWYKSILSIPIKAFKIGETLINKEKPFSCLNNTKRTQHKIIYNNSPWYSCLLNFEVDYCIEVVNYSDIEYIEYINNITSPSVNIIRLLQIQNYEKVILLFNESTCMKEVMYIAIDELIFQILQEEWCVSVKSNIIFGLIKIILLNKDDNAINFDKISSIPSFLNLLIYFVNNKIYSPINEIEFLIKLAPDLYNLCLNIDYYILMGSEGNKNLPISIEINEQIKNYIEKEIKYFEKTIIKQINKTFNKLCIFFNSDNYVSLNKYIMEIDILPQDDSCVKSHFNSILNKKIITTTLTRSVSCLSEASENQLGVDNFETISRVLNESLHTLESYRSVNYLYLMLLYIQTILNEILNFSRNITFIPILSLKPIELISYSFFHEQNIDGSNKLSKLIKENFLHAIIRTINSSNFNNVLSGNISNEKLEFFYNYFVNDHISFGLIIHNILPISSVDFGYKAWEFALCKKSETQSVNNTQQIMYNLLKYRVKRYEMVNIVKERINSSICSFIFKKIQYLIFTNYFFILDRWLNLIFILYNLEVNNEVILKTLNDEFYTGSSSLFSSSSINIAAFLIFYKLFRKVIEVKFNKEVFTLIGVKKLTRIIYDPFLIYKLIIILIDKWDPHSILDVIDISLKNIRAFGSSDIKYLSTNKKVMFIRNNVHNFLLAVRGFCIGYINSFDDYLIWKEWSRIIKNWSSIKGIVSIVSFLKKIKLFKLADFVCNSLLNEVIENNGDEKYTKKMLNKLFSDGSITGEIRLEINSKTDRSLIKLKLNNIISNLSDCFNIEKHGFNLINSFFLSKINDFDTVIKLFNKITKIEEKYLFIETLISSQGLISDINKVNVLKTISLSLKMMIELNLKQMENIYLYFPYLVLRIAILKRNNRALCFLRREIDIFLRSDQILFMIIEESFGIKIDNFVLNERIRSSSIFGQANSYDCFKLFRIMEEDEFNGFNSIINNISTDICFNISLLSLLPNNERVCDFVFRIANELSVKLNILFKNYVFICSSIQNNFEKSFVWVKEEGALKTTTTNLHPFSKFKNSILNASTNYNILNAYKGKKHLTKEYLGPIYRTTSESVLNNSNEFLSILRLHMRNLIKLLRWGTERFSFFDFSFAISSLPFLFELWFKDPGAHLSLKDVLFLKYDFFSSIITIDKLELGKSVFNLNINKILNESGEKSSCELDSELLKIKKLLHDSILFSDIGLDCIDLISISNYTNNVYSETTTSKSRNKMILEIFYKKWNIPRFKSLNIAMFDKDTTSLIEYLLFSRFGTLNLLVINLFLTSISWNIIISDDIVGYEFILPLKFTDVLKNEDEILKLFEIYCKSFESSKKIRRKPINRENLLQKWIHNFAISQIFEPYLQGVIDSKQNGSRLMLALEQISIIFKRSIYLFVENKSQKIKTETSEVLDYFRTWEKIKNQNKSLKHNLINHILSNIKQNHVSVINSLTKFNFWWEVMVYILRWSFELGYSKSRSLLLKDKREKSNIKSFDALYCELVVKKSHSLNQLESLIIAMNQALPFGGPRTTVTIRRCRQVIQKYLVQNGSLEILYISIICTALNNDIPHAFAGTIAIHLSLVNSVDFDARMGYLNLALHHFAAANWSLRRRQKIGPGKKRPKTVNITSGFQNVEKECIENSLEDIHISDTQFGKIRNILVNSIGDVPIDNLNTSPWGGLSLLSLQKIIKLIELQDSIIFKFARENSHFSILNPGYEYRRDTIIKLFLMNEFSLAFKACEILDIPLFEILVLTTKRLVESHQTNKPLSKFLDSMKCWLSIDDADALTSNALNTWISEKKINLNSMEDREKKSLVELIEKFAGTLNKEEAYNMISSSEPKNLLK